MSAVLPVRMQKMREEWSSNPRLRWGAVIALAIGFLYLCLVLVDWRRDLHHEYQQRTLQLYKMTALAGQEQWLLRAQAAQAVEKAVQAEIPNAATIGLAQAEVQTRQLMLAQSLQATELARNEANRQTRYLSVSVNPVAADEAAYPRAFESTLVVMLIMIGIYLMITMTIAILYEQVTSG